jgi:hypothetical protein
VPCHRVIRSDGKLGGYNRGGEEGKKDFVRKRRGEFVGVVKLLAHPDRFARLKKDEVSGHTSEASTKMTAREKSYVP